jgi:hypothetical protein
MFQSKNPYGKSGGEKILCEISSSHGGEYDILSSLIPDDGGSTHL